MSVFLHLEHTVGGKTLMRIIDRGILTVELPVERLVLGELTERSIILCSAPPDPAPAFRALAELGLAVAYGVAVRKLVGVHAEWCPVDRATLHFVAFFHRGCACGLSWPTTWSWCFP